MSAALERRYRRLLALYPVGHRAEYGEEMHGLLMERARSGQRWPGFGEAFDLARHAVGARFGRLPGGLADVRWRDAAAVAGVVLPLLLLAARVRGSINGAGLYLTIGQGVPAPDGPWIAWTAGWVAAVVALAAGLRRTAAGCAWLAVLVEAVLLGAGYRSDPNGLVYGTRFFAVGVVAAAALSVPAPRWRGFALLGRLGLALSVAAAVVFASAGLLDPLLVTGDVLYSPTPGAHGDLAVHLLEAPGAAWPTAVAYAGVGLLLLLVLARLDRPVRRRVAALLLPALAQYLLVRFTFGGFLASSPRFWPTPVLLVWPQWLALALTPVLAFAAGAAWVAHADRRDHLLRLGREREREATAGPAAP